MYSAFMTPLIFPDQDLSQLMGNHARFISLTDDDEYQPCCSPSRYTELNIIYINDDGQIVLKNIPDLVVETCNCL